MEPRRTRLSLMVIGLLSAAQPNLSAGSDVSVSTAPTQRDTSKVLQQYAIAGPASAPPLLKVKPSSHFANTTVKRYQALPLGDRPSSAISADDLETNHEYLPNDSVPIVDVPSPPDAISAAIAALLEQKTNPIQWQGIDNRLRSSKEVMRLYASLNYRPLWSQNGIVRPIAREVIVATLASKYHALSPEVYHTLATSSIQVGLKVAEPAKFDVVLTDAFITYKKHLTNGIVDPKAQFSTWNTLQQAIDFKDLYLTISDQGQLGDALGVDAADYRVLQKTYEALLKSHDQGSDTHLPAITSSLLKLSQNNEQVRLLRQHLGLNDDSMYDESVKAAVKQFQRENHLSTDGIAGKKTIAVLNSQNLDTITRLQKLAINLERYRWSYVPANTIYVWVNIPAYKMAIRDNGKYLFASDVIVGKSGEEYQTPIFSDTLKYVVLAPYWNVPASIFKREKLPSLVRNESLEGNIQVIDKSTGKLVDPTSVDWSQGIQNYRLRQRPGALNALGYMKFLFPNKYAIYLHDTPGRHLFKRKYRALSHGCIRVARAQDLALFLIQDQGYDHHRIKAVSRQDKEKWVNLPNSKRYPVFLRYYTAWVDRRNRVHYSRDIYGYDKKMQQLYQSALKKL